MERANRHFRATWWFNAYFFRVIAMVVNNTWAVRKSFGIKERAEDVRLLIADQFLSELKRDYDLYNRGNDLDGSDYVPLFRRDWQSLNELRLNSNLDHFPAKLKYVYRQCVYERKNHSKTNNYCTTCKVHLHSGLCYQLWHKQQKL